MRVYALTGVNPEIQAYAMAKYSRSAQSMRASIAELSAQRAEQFLETFYFQYGHRSIADLAHLAMAVEEISILAAVALVDEPVWDGQERSTRYQDFRRSGYVTPDEVQGTAVESAYTETAGGLFAAYHKLTRRLTDLLAEAYPAPEGTDEAAHKRTLRARALDVARALLPLATRTSVGQITSARVLERQISRLAAHPLAEVRSVGDALRQAARTPADDLTRESIAGALNGHAASVPGLADLLRPEAPAATLVKYADAATYPPAARSTLAAIATRVLGDLTPDRHASVELTGAVAPEVETVAALLYASDAGGRSYRQVQDVAGSLSLGERDDIIDAALQGRGPHDEWLREFQSGYAFTFDFLIDAGAFRDLHRHRRCVQLVQPYTTAHGPVDAEAWVRDGTGRAADSAITAGIAGELQAGFDHAGAGYQAVTAGAPVAAPYLLPLGYRMRAAFKMDLAQAAYMIELRTKPGGHISYRRAAYAMYRTLREQHPSLARHIRAVDPDAEDALLTR